MIPFPAVSICSSEKFTKDKIDVDKFNDALGDIERNQSAILNRSPEEYVKRIFTATTSALDFGYKILKSDPRSIFKAPYLVNPEHLRSSLTWWVWPEKQFMNFSAYRINRFDAIMHLCFKEVINWREPLDIPRTETIYKTIKGISPDQSSVILFATWLGQIAHFKPIFTGEGLCYTFNAINSKDIYSDECVRVNICWKHSSFPYL